MKRLLLFTWLCLATLLPGCASTHVVSSWQLPLAATHPQFKHLYVIALTPLDAVSVQLEQALVERLREEGIAATAARREFTEKELRDPAARERIAAAVKASGADGVLQVAYLHKSEKQVYVPPSPATAPAWVGPPPYWGYPGYFPYGYDAFYQPGYYATSTEYFAESSLYPAGSDTAVWQAESATVDPDTIAAGIRSFSGKLVKELKQSGALAR